MDLGLRGNVAIVTGGALGLGRAIAVALASQGVRVFIADIKESEAKQATAQILKSGGEAQAIVADVSNIQQVEAMVAQVMKQFGLIHILVNNAGIVGPQGPWHELSEEGFDRVWAINFKGMYLCSKAVAKQMIAQKSGRIINISSCAGKTGERFNGCYSATKAAAINMTQSMAHELAPYNITVNALCPAAMDTDLMETVYRERAKWFGMAPDELRQKIKTGFPLPYALTVEDVADMAAFLVSGKAKSITGQAINVTGGIEMH